MNDTQTALAAFLEALAIESFAWDTFTRSDGDDAAVIYMAWQQARTERFMAEARLLRLCGSPAAMVRVIKEVAA